jgi:hypothetical protein
MVPFTVTDLFKGFAAQALGGIDCSPFVGLPVAAALYWAMCGSLDLEAERTLIAAEGLL